MTKNMGMNRASSIMILIFSIVILYTIKINAQSNCSCGKNDFKQQLGIFDPTSSVAFNSACVSDVFMGQQTITFCISNVTNKELEVYAQAIVVTATGNKVTLEKIHDYIGPKKTINTPWTARLAYVFDDNQRKKFGDVKSISKISVWIEGSGNNTPVPDQNGIITDQNGNKINTKANIDCSIVQNTSACSKIKALCAKLSSLSIADPEYINVFKQWTEESAKKPDCFNDDDVEIMNADIEKNIEVQRKVKEAEEKVNKEIDAQTKRNTKEIKEFKPAADSIKLGSKPKKKPTNDPFGNSKPIYAPKPGEPSSDPIDPVRFMTDFNDDSECPMQMKNYRIDPTGSIKLEYRIVSFDASTKGSIVYKLKYRYSNIRRDGQYVIVTPSLGVIVSPNDPYGPRSGQLEARTVGSFSKVEHVQINMGFFGELYSEVERMEGAPRFFAAGKEFCNLSLPPNFRSDEYDWEVSIPSGIKHPDDACNSIYLYFVTTQDNIQAYCGYGGMRNVEIFNNKFIKITCSMVKTGKVFYGDFFNRAACKEPSHEYSVMLTFENISNRVLSKKEKIFTQSLIFDAPQYFGPGLTFTSFANAGFGITVPTFHDEDRSTVPNKPRQRIAIPALVPREPGRRLNHPPFNVYVHDGVPCWFLPSLDIGNYENDFYVVPDATATEIKECHYAIVWYKGTVKCAVPPSKNGLSSEPSEVEFLSVTNLINVPPAWGGPAYKPAGWGMFIDKDQARVSEKRKEILDQYAGLKQKWPNCNIPLEADQIPDRCK